MTVINNFLYFNHQYFAPKLLNQAYLLFEIIRVARNCSRIRYRELAQHPAGIEPKTSGLRGRCASAELQPAATYGHFLALRLNPPPSRRRLCRRCRQHHRRRRRRRRRRPHSGLLWPLFRTI